MADSKLTALTEETAPVDADLLYLVDDVAGTPTSKKITLANIKAAILAALVSDTDYGAGWNGDTTVAPSKNAVYDQMEVRQKRIYAATMYRSTNQTGITDATWTDVDFSTELFDDNSLADVTTNQFTAPAAGRWRIMAGLEATTPGGDPTTVYARIYKNGTTVVGYSGGNTGSAVYDVVRVPIVSGWKTCAASDTFKVQVFIDATAGTGTLGGDSDAASTWATFEFIPD